MDANGSLALSITGAPRLADQPNRLTFTPPADSQLRFLSVEPLHEKSGEISLTTESSFVQWRNQLNYLGFLPEAETSERLAAVSAILTGYF